MATLREIHTRFSFGADGTQLASIKADAAAVKAQLVDATKAAEGFKAQAAGAFGTLRAAVAGYLTLATGNALTFGFASEATKISKVAEALGMATEDAQTWQYALKGAGVEGDAASAVLAKIQRAAGMAATGTGEAVDTFHKLGFSAAELKNMPMGTLLPRLLGAFAKLPAGGARTAAAMKLFEEQGSKLLPFLMKGAKGADELKTKLAQAGVIMSASTIETAKKATAAQKDLAMQLTGVKNTIAAALLPEVARITSAVAKWLRESVGLKRIVEIVKGIGAALLVAVGYMAVVKIGMFVAALARAAAGLRAMGLAAALANGALLLIPLAILAIIGLVDDLYHFWKGDRQTLVGKLLGEDGQARLRNWITEFVNLGDTIQNSRAAEIFGAAWETAGSIVDGVQTGVAWLWETMEEFWDWLSSPPSEGEGWLGVVRALVHTIYLSVKKLFDAGKQIKEFFLGEDLEKAVGLEGAPLDAAARATAPLTDPYVELQRKALALGMPVGYGDVEASHSQRVDLQRAESLAAQAGTSPAAAAELARLQSESSAMSTGIGDGGSATLRELAANARTENIENHFAAQLTVNAPGADPRDVARLAGEEIDKLLKSTYQNYRRSGATR